MLNAEFGTDETRIVVEALKLDEEDLRGKDETWIEQQFSINWRDIVEQVRNEYEPREILEAIEDRYQEIKDYEDEDLLEPISPEIDPDFGCPETRIVTEVLYKGEMDEVMQDFEEGFFDYTRIEDDFEREKHAILEAVRNEYEPEEILEIARDSLDEEDEEDEF